MRHSLLTSHATTRMAFVVIIVFVTAQMSWWIYFQTRYVGEVNAATLSSLDREARAIDALLDAGSAERAFELLEEQPNLRLNATGTATEVDQQALAAFLARQRSVVRMLAFEGPFFVLVVMGGLFVISRNLRLERELKRRQSNFLDAVGHEYKTPIGTLRLLIETLQLRSVAPEKQREYLRNMSLEVDRLEHTGQQVLATARLEAAAQAATPEPNDLSALVKGVLERNRAVLATRGARIELDAPPGPLTVRAGPDDISTIVENLVDNAVKYTPDADKRVAIRTGRSGPWASLSVTDDGSGISEADQPQVFERFYRVGNEMTRTTSGLGLGLYLVQRTVATLGGSVRLAANPSGGTIVTVLLPLHSTDATTNPPVRARATA